MVALHWPGISSARDDNIQDHVKNSALCKSICNALAHDVWRKELAPESEYHCLKCNCCLKGNATDRSKKYCLCPDYIALVQLIS